jgi:hypothetical protein
MSDVLIPDDDVPTTTRERLVAALAAMHHQHETGEALFGACLTCERVAASQLPVIVEIVADWIANNIYGSWGELDGAAAEGAFAYHRQFRQEMLP